MQANGSLLAKLFNRIVQSIYKNAPLLFCLLSNSSLKSKVQTSVLGLGVDFVFPLSQEQEQEEQEEQPPPKYIRRGCTRGLKFDT